MIMIWFLLVLRWAVDVAYRSHNIRLTSMAKWRTRRNQMMLLCYYYQPMYHSTMGLGEDFFVLIFAVFLQDFFFLYHDCIDSPMFRQNVHVFDLYTLWNQNVHCAVSRQRPLPRKRLWGSRVGAIAMPSFQIWKYGKSGLITHTLTVCMDHMVLGL